MNQLSEVREFVKGEGQATGYNSLRVNYIPHHPPVIVFFEKDGTTEAETIDMAEYDKAGLHKLLQDRGFKQKEII